MQSLPLFLLCFYHDFQAFKNMSKYDSLSEVSIPITSDEEIEAVVEKWHELGFIRTSVYLHALLNHHHKKKLVGLLKSLL